MNHKKDVEQDLAKTYNQFKSFEGRRYTGMKVGGHHKWYYDKGVWHDTKLSPDLWGISYAVTKRRAGHAPKGSGASVGTDYHWVILSHQLVEKLNADDYSTVMTGIKFKLAHKREGKEKWNNSSASQRKHLVQFLKDMIAQLQQAPIPLHLEVNGQVYKGEAIPVMATLTEGKHQAFELWLNDKNMGLLRRLKSGWKIATLDDNKLIAAIAKVLEEERM